MQHRTAAILIALGTAGCASDRLLKETGELIATPSELDFGIQSPGIAIEMSTSVANRRIQAAMIAARIEGDTRGTFMLLTTPTRFISPGETEIVSVRYLGDLDGVDEADLTVVAADAPNAPLHVHLRGETRSTPQPHSVDASVGTDAHARHDAEVHDATRELMDAGAPAADASDPDAAATFDATPIGDAGCPPMTVRARTVSASGDHGCSVLEDSTLWCWGSNVYDQLGTSAPGGFGRATVPSDTGWSEVESGDGYTCALRMNGSMWCWGAAWGTATHVPQEPIPGASWRTFTASPQHVCGIQTDGSLWCWGLNFWGTLGTGVQGDFTPEPPAQVGMATWAQIAAGFNHTCGIQSDGSMWCWGSNWNSQLGNGGIDGAPELSPIRTGTASNWVSISCGVISSCGIDDRHGLWCWGQEDEGQLGLGSNVAVEVPHPTMVGASSDWAEIDTGNRSSCAIRSSGELDCFGNDYFGELGIGAVQAPDEASPSPIIGNKTWTMVSVSEMGWPPDQSEWVYGGTACALDTEGAVYCWGSGYTGTPTQICLP